MFTQRELSIIAEDLDARLKSGAFTAEERAEREELADKVVNMQEAEQDDDGE